MPSLALFFKLLKTLPPKKQIFNVLLVAVGLWGCAALYYSQLRIYTSPDVSRLFTLDGWVSSHPYAWEHDSAVLRFGASYRMDGAKHVHSVYVNQAIYEQSGLRIGSKVRLTVEAGEQGTVLRGLSTQEGRVLFDDAFNRRIVEWNNESVWRNVVLLVFLSVGPLLAALRIAWKHRRTLF